MFNVKDIEYARRIARHISFPEQFGMDEDMDTSGYEYQLEDVIDGDYFVTCGVSKLVIVVGDLPFVIKVSFNGAWAYNWDDSENYFYKFTQANSDFGDDYCADELSATISLKDEGFGKFVPDMMWLGKYNGHDFFVQMKAKPLCDIKKLNATPDSLAKVALSNKSVFRDDWLALVYDFYGEDEWNRFIEWARAYDPEILADMHHGNYGIDKEGRPVLIDISGFRD